MAPTPTKEEPSPLALTADDDIPDDYQIISKYEVPKANDESPEEGFETIKLAAKLVEINIDKEEWVADDLTSSDAKKKLLGEVKDALAEATKIMKYWEREGSYQEFSKGRTRVEALEKAVEVIESCVKE